MRVIAGSAKGVTLFSPKGKKTRPIQDRIKESLFHILSDIIPDSRVIELFAGTGAMGIEALSRGAASCIFIENDRAAINIIQKNLDSTGLQHNALILKKDVFRIVSYLEKCSMEFDLVIACPPYPLVDKVFFRDKLLVSFSLLYDKRILQSEGLIVLQQRKATFEIPPQANSIKLFDTRIYGDTQLSFFKNIQECR